MKASDEDVALLCGLGGKEAWETICAAYPELDLASSAHMIAYIPMAILRDQFMTLAIAHGVDTRLWPMWENAYRYVQSLRN